MVRKWILLSLVILFMVGTVQAGELTGSLNVTWASRYIWRGFDMYNNNHGAIQASVDLDLYETGFGTSVFWSRATGRGYELLEEVDVSVWYSNNFLEGERFATDYTVGWMYYNHPQNGAVTRDMQEFFASLSWPELLPGGLVPSYTIICMWEAYTGSSISGAGGWMHVFGLDYAWEVNGFLPNTDKQVLDLSGHIVYNDGMFGAAVAHDWSHMILGVSTDFEIAENVTITPGLYYQNSWEASINTQDEFWVALTVGYSF